MPPISSYIDWKQNSHFDPPPPEVLGFYARIYHLNTLNFNGFPSIYICPENIKIICKPKSNEAYQIILTDVIIHEFAHALMDDNGKQFTYMN